MGTIGAFFLICSILVVSTAIVCALIVGVLQERHRLRMLEHDIQSEIVLQLTEHHRRVGR